MEVYSREIVRALGMSVENLRQGIDAHRRLVASILGQAVEDQDLPALLNFCPGGSREMRLEQAIKEAIEVIEESRKAFKSKKLEALRKKLTRTLIDAD